MVISVVSVNISRRECVSQRRKLLSFFLSLSLTVFALVLCFLMVGINPVKAIWTLVSHAFSSSYGFSEVLVKTAPLILTGLAVSVGMKMQLWNLGAEGQLYFGALGAVWAARTLAELPAIVMIPVMIFTACIFSGFLGLIIGVLKSTLFVNEILSSLMLNYVATALVIYFVYGPWRDKNALGFPRTAYIQENAKFARFFGTRIHLGLFLALALALAMWIVFEKTVWGFEVRATGQSKGGAEYAGIKIGCNTIIIFIISSALAGIAGLGEICGVHHRLQQSNLAAGYGNYGVVVAWLAGTNLVNVPLIAVLLSIILVGADQLQVSLGVSSDAVQIVLAVVMFGILFQRFFLDHKIIIRINRKRQ